MITWEKIQKFLEMSNDWKNLQVSSRLLVIQDIISTTTTTTTTTTASDAKLANDAHLLEREFKIREMSKVWKILQVSSTLLVIQDIISTTTASDAKLANDAHLLERKFKNSRDVESLENPPS